MTEQTSGPLGDLHSARVLVAQAAEAVAAAERRCVESSAEQFMANEARERDGQKLYVLLAYFDKRDGTYMAEMVRAAREGWERSHPDMAEDDAWEEFDRLWERRREALEAPEWCEQCEVSPATTNDWGPWLCAACSDSTLLGDGGAE